MMMTYSTKHRSAQLWVFIIVTLCTLDSCHGIYCFVCTSLTNDACGDDFRISTSDSKLRFQCDGGSCLKRRGTRVEGSVRRVEIIRSCVTRTQESCYDANFNNLNYYTCACNYDFCNASVKLKSWSISAFLFALLISFYSQKANLVSL